MKKITYSILGLLAMAAVSISGLSSCSDNMDESNYYTFKGQMMSQYLQQNAEYSEFAQVVEKAGLMDMLSAWGSYTLFAPNNDAMNAYLAENGLSIENMSAESCDTLARLHLIDEMYSISQMSDGTLDHQNMLGRDMIVSHTTDADKNPVVKINDCSTVFYKLQDDTVENGIVQPVDAVVRNSNEGVSKLVSGNKNITIFSEAFEKTGVNMLMQKTEDASWAAKYKSLSKKYDDAYKTGGRSAEACYVPEKKLYGYTVFVVTDSALKASNINNITDLYNVAKEVFDSIYPEDVNKPGHDIANLTDSINPLNRLMRYHVLNRMIHGYNLLTVKGDLGINTDEVNPTEWYPTLLPYTMIKMEHLTATSMKSTYSNKFAANEQYFINRYYDGNKHKIEGVHVSKDTPGYTNNGPNGYYFYVDSLLKFNKTVRDVVDNVRMRMDFSTIFPEIDTNNQRMTGEGTASGKAGTNYYYPDGYLDGVKMSSDTRFIYFYPRSGYYSMNGDEFDVQDNFDFTFNLPPVPKSGMYQIRLGFAPMTTGSPDNAAYRGQAQVYFDGVAQGLPVDFSRTLNEVKGVTASYYNNKPTDSPAGQRYTEAIRDNDAERQADFKALKNAGYYRGPWSVFNSATGVYSAGIYNTFADMKNTARKVLCTVYIDATKTHTLTLKNVSTVLKKRKEAMLDYLELVPKSVYGISDGDDVEDDL